MKKSLAQAPNDALTYTLSTATAATPAGKTILNM